jgi:nitrogen fixation/metabolism regulation signal transduction histidine kinase
MVLNRFSLLIFFQIVLIAVVGMLITISLQREFLLMTSVGLILLWIGQILFLNVHMNRIHRDVRKFMDALRSQDTSQFFNDQKAAGYFKGIYYAFNEITRNFRLVRIEKEVENQFYRETIRHSASGIVAVEEKDKIPLINQAALEVLGMDSLINLGELRDIHPNLADLFSTGGSGDQHTRILVNGRMVQLAVKCTEMNLDGTSIRIFSLLDITREMARNEIEAWQKLIRVLHHEITNSVVPLHILSTSLFDLFHIGDKQKSAREMDDETIDRMILGLKTLVKRSGGLNEFINNYESFTRMGEASYSTFSVEELINRVISLLEDELARGGVEIDIKVSPTALQMKADEKLIEQTLINLVKNSIFALEKSRDPRIQLKAWQTHKQVFIEVTDNGRGISEEIIESIFTPFFTTRKGGSGIGLSLARQVMLMHNGSINVASEEGKQTTFKLTF